MKNSVSFIITASTVFAGMHHFKRVTHVNYNDEQPVYRTPKRKKRHGK
jgi:hypothetical protein